MSALLPAVNQLFLECPEYWRHEAWELVHVLFPRLHRRPGR